MINSKYPYLEIYCSAAVEVNTGEPTMGKSTDHSAATCQGVEEILQNCK